MGSLFSLRGGRSSKPAISESSVTVADPDQAGLVSAWPVITVTYDADGSMTATDGMGYSELYPVSEDVHPSEVAVSAAMAAAEARNLRKVRVDGVDPEGNVHHMMIDTQAQVLTPITPDAWATKDVVAEARQKRIKAVNGPLSRRNLLIMGASAVGVAAVGAGAVAYRNAAQQPETVAEKPDTRAQLPVLAPAGFDTLAAWTATIDGAAVPTVLGSWVLVGQKNDVVALNAADGAEAWREPFSSAVAALASTASVPKGTAPVAVAVTSKEIMVISASGERTRVPLPGQGQVKTFPTGTAMVWQQGTEQRAHVLVGADVQDRIVPAGSGVLGAIGPVLVAASMKSPEISLIKNSDVKLPKPLGVQAPSTEATKGQVLGMVGEFVLSAWSVSSKAVTGKILVIDRISPKGALERAHVSKVLKFDASSIKVDPQGSSAMIGQLWAHLGDKPWTELVKGTGRPVGGRAFFVQDSMQVSRTPEGKEFTAQQTQLYPAVMINGRALVTAGTGKNSKIYALEANK
jgi:hypothetical protein